jgi:hypothetical protein
MRYALLGLAASAAFVLSLASASAQLDSSSGTTSAAPASADAVSTSNGDPNKLVCKRLGETGTRLGSKRICQTQAEWDEQERQNKLNLTHEQNRGNLFSTPGG